MSWHVCRICLASDVKTYTIVNTQFQDIYEKITGYKWARDDRPSRICFICKSQLQRSLKFQQMSKLSEETFDQILAVGFEFTEEILPILYKRRLQTVEIAPVSIMIIEPTADTRIKEEIKEIKEPATHERRFNTLSSSMSIACVGNKESSSISKLQKLGISPKKNSTFFSICDVNKDYDADEIKEEIKTIEDDANKEDSQEEIFKMDNSSRKEDIKTNFKKNSLLQFDIFKSSPLNKKAFVYIPTPVMTDFSLDDNDKSNLMDETKNVIRKNEENILTNNCKMSSTPNNNTLKKGITLTFKLNDIITPRQSLEKNYKEKKDTQESSKRNGKIEVLSVRDFNKSFTKKGQFLEKYMKSKGEGNKFTCDICNRSFNRKISFTLHMKIHNGDRQFECDKCPKTYTRLHYLNRHKIYHSSKKPFVCKICHKGFNQRSNLDQHKRSHTGERPYSCKVCNKRFIQLCHLLQHNRVHSGEKPYSCICGKSYSQKSGLFHHRRTHNSVQPFSCDICGRGFYQKIHLNSHLKKAHSLSLSDLKSPAQKCPAEKERRRREKETFA